MCACVCVDYTCEIRNDWLPIISYNNRIYGECVKHTWLPSLFENKRKSEHVCVCMLWPLFFFSSTFVFLGLCLLFFLYVYTSDDDADDDGKIMNVSRLLNIKLWWIVSHTADTYTPHTHPLTPTHIHISIARNVYKLYINIL